MNDSTGKHGPLAPKLDADGRVVGHYTKCQRCRDTHRGLGPYAGTKKSGAW